MLQKIRDSKVLRYLLLFLCCIFILSSALNDGETKYFLGLPFLVALYYLIPNTVISRKVLCFGVFVTVIAVSQLKYFTSIVYPVVGEEFQVTQNIPVSKSKDGTYFFSRNENIQRSEYTYDIVDIKPENLKNYIKAGERLTVKSVEVTHYGSVGDSYSLILETGDAKKLKVLNVDVGKWLHTENGKALDLCFYVEGPYCDYGLTHQYRSNPMRPLVQQLTLLMYYPWLPFLIFVSLVS